MTLQSRLSDLITAIGTDYKQLRTYIAGSSTADLTGLTTSAKTSLLAAINEVNGKVGGQINDTTPSSTSVYSSSKTNSQIAAQSTTDRARANHTGTQLASTISDFASAADARVLNQSGIQGGYAPLDATVKVPAVYLPSYVDDVVEYATVSAFPATGETGKIYVVTSGSDIDKEYRWSGSAYRQLTSAPGTSDAVVEGTVNLYYTAARSALLLTKANNLSDVAAPATALANLGGLSTVTSGNVDVDLVALYTTAKS